MKIGDLPVGGGGRKLACLLLNRDRGDRGLRADVGDDRGGVATGGRRGGGVQLFPELGLQTGRQEYKRSYQETESRLDHLHFLVISIP